MIITKEKLENILKELYQKDLIDMMTLKHEEKINVDVTYQMKEKDLKINVTFTVKDF